MALDELDDAIVMLSWTNNTEIVFCDPSFQTSLLEAKWQPRTDVSEVARLSGRFPTFMRKISE
jgi:hypothetical protein